MSLPSHCLLDLDGTIINSAPGITDSVRYALRKMGRELPDGFDLHRFIGPPLLSAFSDFCGMDIAEAERAVALYREHYRAGAMLQCTVYDGIAETLSALTAMGIPFALATCKPWEFARQILSHFALLSGFSGIYGPEMDGTRNTKAEVIAFALQQLHWEPSAVLMVGDRADDVNGATACGIPCAGALWGFGSREELTGAGACTLLHRPTDLISLWKPSDRL